MVKRYDCEVIYFKDKYLSTEFKNRKNGKYVLYEDIKHILERSDNSDYAKCAEEIYNATFSSSDIFTVEKIEQILKTHFA